MAYIPRREQIMSRKYDNFDTYMTLEEIPEHRRVADRLYFIRELNNYQHYDVELAQFRVAFDQDALNAKILFLQSSMGLELSEQELEIFATKQLLENTRLTLTSTIQNNKAAIEGALQGAVTTLTSQLATKTENATFEAAIGNIEGNLTALETSTTSKLSQKVNKEAYDTDIQRLDAALAEKLNVTTFDHGVEQLNTSIQALEEIKLDATVHDESMAQLNAFTTQTVRSLGLLTTSVLELEDTMLPKSEFATEKAALQQEIAAKLGEEDFTTRIDPYATREYVRNYVGDEIMVDNLLDRDYVDTRMATRVPLTDYNAKMSEIDTFIDVQETNNAIVTTDITTLNLTKVDKTEYQSKVTQLETAIQNAASNISFDSVNLKINNNPSITVSKNTTLGNYNDATATTTVVGGVTNISNYSGTSLACSVSMANRALSVVANPLHGTNVNTSGTTAVGSTLLLEAPCANGGNASGYGIASAGAQSSVLIRCLGSIGGETPMNSGVRKQGFAGKIDIYSRGGKDGKFNGTVGGERDCEINIYTTSYDNAANKGIIRLGNLDGSLLRIQNGAVYMYNKLVDLALLDSIANKLNTATYTAKIAEIETTLASMSFSDNPVFNTVSITAVTDPAHVTSKSYVDYLVSAAASSKVDKTDYNAKITQIESMMSVGTSVDLGYGLARDAENRILVDTQVIPTNTTITNLQNWINQTYNPQFSEIFQTDEGVVRSSGIRYATYVDGVKINGQVNAATMTYYCDNYTCTCDMLVFGASVPTNIVYNESSQALEAAFKLPYRNTPYNAYFPVTGFVDSVPIIAIWLKDGHPDYFYLVKTNTANVGPVCFTRNEVKGKAIAIYGSFRYKLSEREPFPIA